MQTRRKVSTAPALRVTFADEGFDGKPNTTGGLGSKYASNSINKNTAFNETLRVETCSSEKERTPAIIDKSLPVSWHTSPGLQTSSLGSVKTSTERKLSAIGRNHFLRSFGTLTYYEVDNEEIIPKKEDDISEVQRQKLKEYVASTTYKKIASGGPERRRKDSGELHSRLLRRAVSAGPILKRTVDTICMSEDILEIRGKDFSFLDCDQASKIKENIRKQSAKRRIRRIRQADMEKAAEMEKEIESNEKSRGNNRSLRGATPAVTTHTMTTGGAFESFIERKRRLSQRREWSRSTARTKFRWAVVVVRVLCRVRNIMAESSARKACETVAQGSWNDLKHASEAKEILFNMAIFQKGKSQYAYVPEWAKRILAISPMARTEMELSQLHSMCNGLQSYDKFAYRIQMAMCKAMVYQRVGHPRVVLRKGHEGVAFYFIYSGSVFVNIEELLKKSGQVTWHTSTILHRGDSFGELALLRKIKRTASVVVREDVELLVVDKEVFATTCPKLYDKELEDKVNFCKSLKLFEEWTGDMLQNICFEAQIKACKSNKIIVKDSSKDTEWLYLCMQGKCSVVKALDLKPSSRAMGPRKVKFEDSYFTMLGRRKTRSQTNPDAWKKDLEKSLKGAFSFAHKDKNVDESRDDSEGERSDSDSDYDSRKEAMSERGGSAKERIIEVMTLSYANMSHARGDSEYLEVQESESECEDDDDDDTEKSAQILEKKMESDSFTFSDLMMIQSEAGQLNKDVVYLNIASLKQGDIFDISEVLMPTGRKLMLVSTGLAVMLRIKRADYLQYSTKSTLKHARNIALETDYPTDDTVYRSYNERCAWENFKKKHVYTTMGDVRDTRHHVTMSMTEVKKPLTSAKGVLHKEAEERRRLDQLHNYLYFVYGPNKAFTGRGKKGPTRKSLNSSGVKREVSSSSVAIPPRQNSILVQNRHTRCKGKQQVTYKDETDQESTELTEQP